MLTRNEVIEACLRLPDAFEDYPFDDPNWTAMRHRENDRVFALIFQREGLIDELSLVLSPVLAAAGDRPLFDQGVVAEYKLLQTRQYEDGMLWLNYKR